MGMLIKSVATNSPKQIMLAVTSIRVMVSIFLDCENFEMLKMTRIIKSDMTKVSLSIPRKIDIAKLPAPDMLCVRVKYTASVFSSGNISAREIMPLMQNISSKSSIVQHM